jgi:hypothetical protein
MVFSLGPWSARIQPEFRVLRLTWDAHPGSRMVFAYRAFTLYGWLFQHHSANHAVCNCPIRLRPDQVRSHNPDRATPAGFNTRSVWAVPLSLTTTQGISFDFFSSGY